ncbi:MAG: hypothetical protein QE263_04030 [Vampirovibrionales bacterium]|nr:hypothetical protein [Vampirovibrionales bacterium]
MTKPNQFQKRLKEQHKAYEIGEQLSYFSVFEMGIFIESTALTPLAFQYFQFGLMRRLMIIQKAYSWIIQNIPVERSKPLSLNEVENLNIHLNTIYLHLKGALDNFCWAIVHQALDPNAVRELSTQSVNLFAYRKATLEVTPYFLNGTALYKAIERLKPWDKQIKSRRDPGAHRIPLTVPPSIQTDIENVQYRSTEEKVQRIQLKRNEDSRKFRATLSVDVHINEWDKQMKTLHSIYDNCNEQVSTLYKELESIGTFHPVFIQPPESKTTPLYPTIPNDIENLLLILKAGLETIRTVHSPAKATAPQ